MYGHRTPKHAMMPYFMLKACFHPHPFLFTDVHMLMYFHLVYIIISYLLLLHGIIRALGVKLKLKFHSLLLLGEGMSEAYW